VSALWPLWQSEEGEAQRGTVVFNPQNKARHRTV
jgi:hypothetical protein